MNQEAITFALNVPKAQHRRSRRSCKKQAVRMERACRVSENQSLRRRQRDREIYNPNLRSKSSRRNRVDGRTIGQINESPRLIARGRHEKVSARVDGEASNLVLQKEYGIRFKQDGCKRHSFPILTVCSLSNVWAQEVPFQIRTEPSSDALTKASSAAHPSPEMALEWPWEKKRRQMRRMDTPQTLP